jgi:hypothetical protein
MPPPSSVASKKRAREAANKAKRSLIAELNLSKDIDPRISEAIFSRVADPVYKITKPGRAQQTRAATKQETTDLFTKSYQAELAKIGQPEIAEAVAAGADPRTIEALTSKLVSAYTNPQMKQTRTMTAAKREAAVAEQTRPTKEKLASEAKIQPTLKEIRRLRQDVAQRGASLLRRNTGSRALLSSPTGGSGFFGGYFKG